MVIALAAAGWVVSAFVMVLLWAWHLRVANARVAEAGWTVLVGGLAVFYAVVGSGTAQRRMAIAFMMGSWGARLTVHILYDRVFGRPETGRYAALRRSWGEHAPRRFFWLFQEYAAAAVFFSIPALLSSVNGAPGLSRIELAAAGLWIVAFTGETTADRQLVHFKSIRGNAGRTLRSGLWRYLRHPNYFFEWLIWLAYALFASASPFGWLTFACPAAMVFLLRKQTKHECSNHQITNGQITR